MRVQRIALDTAVARARQILGGSGQQSARVLDAMRSRWAHPTAPRHLIKGQPALYKTTLQWDNNITALTAKHKLTGKAPSVEAHP